MLASKTADQETKEKYIMILEGALIAGAILVLAQDVIEWLFGIDFENPGTTAIPPAIIALLGKVIPFVKFVGAGLIVIGVLVSVPKLKFASLIKK